MTQDRHAQQGLPELKLHETPHARERVVRGARLLTVLFLLLLLLGLGRTLWMRRSEASVLQDRSHDSALLHVLVTQPRRGGGSDRLSLPGTLQGRVEAQIYARASGYVKRWLKDIGAPVRKGELLAELDIPEVNRQVDEAAATYELTKTAYERWVRLRAQDAVSQQELDEKTGAFRQAEAVLKRLRDQQAYGQVLAPFDGIVTRRNVNVGDLINAGGGASPALYAMSQVDRLHVYVYVPQERAPQVHVGDAVTLFVASHPERALPARLARSAAAIDLATGTMQVDVEVANADRALLPGESVQAVLTLAPSGTLALPTNTLLFGAAGTQVAVVERGKVQRRSVVLGTDYGQTVDIRSGVSATDQVIVNPPDSIVTGQAVAIESPAAAASRQSAG